MIPFVDPASVPRRALHTGETVPCIGMGTFGSDKYDGRQVAEAVLGGIRAGYRMLDCAQVYGNEALIGEVIETAIQEGTVRRDELFIASKLWNDRHGRGDVLLSCAQTLKDLRIDTLDMYFVHWPFPNYHAPGCDGDSRSPDAVPFSVDRFMAVWRQMERLHSAGLTRHLGMSNMTVAKLDAVLPLCRVQPSMIEMELHPSFQQPELFQYCVDRGILPVGFCPIGSPARPERDRTPEDVVDMELPEVARVAQAHGVHPAIVCIKWAVQRGELAIPFSVRPEQYIENLRCTTMDPLTDAEMESIAKAERNCRLIKGQVFLWEGAKGWEDLWV